MLTFYGRSWKQSLLNGVWRVRKQKSAEMVYRSIYSEIQGDSKQKSVVGVCLMI